MIRSDILTELGDYLKARNREVFEQRYFCELDKAETNSKLYAGLKLLYFNYLIIFNGDFSNVMDYISKTEIEIHNFASNIQMVVLNITKAIVFSRIGKVDEAIEVYEEQLLLCDKYEESDEPVPKAMQVKLLTNLGVAYNRKKEYFTTLQYLLKAYRTVVDNNLDVKLTSLLLNIGTVYLNLAMYNKSLEYFELALTTVSSTQKYSNPQIYIDLITSYTYAKKYDKAREMIALFEKEDYLSNKTLKLAYHKSVGIYYRQTRQFNKSLENYYKVLEMLLLNQNIEKRLQCLITIAEIELENGNQVKCREVIEKIDDLTVIHNINQNRTDIIELKQDYYQNIEDFKQANSYAMKLFYLSKQETSKLKRLLVDELSKPITNTNNISKQAYDQKISELEEINSELKSKDRLLVDSLNDLKKESQLREKFISIISHDIRGPLGNIVQLLEMMDEFEDEAEREEIVADVIDAMRQTYTLTNELVSWAKEIIDNQQSTLSMVNCQELVDNISKLYSEQLNFKQIHLVNNLSDNAIVYAHKTSLETCFRNIVQNAIKYSPTYTKIEVNEEIESSNLKFFITDQGIGMDCQKIEDLFNTSIESQLGTHSEEGIGIGLFLVKELVRKNNGKLKCHSKIGKGTTFIMTFPTSKI
jgi:signal transduction histidine kinase